MRAEGVGGLEEGKVLKAIMGLKPAHINIIPSFYLPFFLGHFSTLNASFPFPFPRSVKRVRNIRKEGGKRGWDNNNGRKRLSAQ